MDLVKEGMDMVLLGLKEQQFSENQLKVISKTSLKIHLITEEMLKKIEVSKLKKDENDGG